MGIRLEYILIIAIVLTISLNTLVKFDNKLDINQSHTKELAFSDTTFIEVNKVKMLAYIFSRYGVRDAGVLTLNDLTYHTENIKLLFANQASYKEDTLFLDGNVTLVEKEGFKYTTQSAKYNQKTEILDINAPFTAKLDKNVIKGEVLHYDAKHKELNASKIDAVVYTLKK